MSFVFELVTPEKLLFSDSVDMVAVPGADGDFGVLAGHAPLISTLRDGVVEVTVNSEVKKFSVQGGFAEVTPSRCTVLATDSQEISG